MNAARILEMIQREMADARRKYGHFTSAHEGYGVLAEEVAELLEAIRANDLSQAQSESCQVAAVAQRIALSLGTPETQHRSGMEDA